MIFILSNIFNHYPIKNIQFRNSKYFFNNKGGGVGTKLTCLSATPHVLKLI